MLTELDEMQDRLERARAFQKQNSVEINTKKISISSLKAKAAVLLMPNLELTAAEVEAKIKQDLSVTIGVFRWWRRLGGDSNTN